MGEVKYFKPLGVAETFRQYCVDNGLNAVTPDDLRRLVDERYLQGGLKTDQMKSIYGVCSTTRLIPLGGRASANKTRFTKIGPNIYRPIIID
ncbi:hypothetical protein M1N53_00905 [Thermodesulfovibrionales bacterium]|nr:hypothetical protein [Thermodesulfovibrionales bacterium]